MAAFIIFLILGFFAFHSAEGYSNIGTEFAIALPYQTMGTDPPTEIVITAVENDAEVNITWILVDQNVTIPAGTSIRFNPGPMRPVVVGEGVEQKTSYLYSDEPVSVYYARERFSSHWQADATIVRPRNRESFVHLLSGCPATGYSTCYAGSPHPYGGYYMVAAYEDDTYVEVHIHRDGNWTIDAQLTLNHQEVYSYSTGGRDWYGYVEASNSVAVHSGNACHRHHPSFQLESSSSQFRHESMPSVAELGVEYATFPVDFGVPEAGYSLRVTASEDHTNVIIPALGVQETIENKGEKFDFDGEGILRSDLSVLVLCSKPCQVTQYSKDVRYVDDEGQPQSAMFMVALTPSHLMNMDLLFDTPILVGSNEYSTRLVIVVESYPPTDDIFLNGVNLKDEDWRQAEGQHGSLSLSIEPGTYYIYTEEEKMRFAAYLYCVRHYYMSIGLNLGYGH